jgi:hypothetical protein
MAAWQHLIDELARWQDRGQIATLWWRDDDATRSSPELVRLLNLGAEQDVPVALAVIPRDVDGSLHALLAAYPRAAVLQHGWSHENHAPGDERQEEHGPHRPQAVMLEELAEGWRRIAAMPGALPVLVAPWNRLDPDLLPSLPNVGLGGVSTLGPRDAAEPAPGVHRTNVHVDIMDWHGSGGFVGDDNALDQVLRHLAARRLEGADPAEPTGLMTHHLYHDENCWRFLEAFLSQTRSHPAVRWLDARDAFWP